MMKDEFLQQLQDALLAGGYTQEEASSSCDFYAEVIADRQENGTQESEVIAQLGDVSEIAEQILAEQPPKEAVDKDISCKSDGTAQEEISQNEASTPNAKTEPSTAMKVLFWCSVPFWTIPLSIFLALLSTFLAVSITFFVCGAILPIVTGACAIGTALLTPFLFTQNIATAIAVIGLSLFLIGLTILIVRPIFYYCVLICHVVRITFRNLFAAFRRRSKLKKEGGTEDETIE